MQEITHVLPGKAWYVFEMNKNVNKKSQPSSMEGLTQPVDKVPGEVRRGCEVPPRTIKSSDMCGGFAQIS